MRDVTNSSLSPLMRIGQSGTSVLVQVVIQEFLDRVCFTLEGGKY